MDANSPCTAGSQRRTRLRKAAAAAAVTAALALAALTAPGLAAGDQVAATLKRVTPVVVKPVGNPGTNIKAKGSSWALPATATGRVTATTSARGSSWS